MRKELNTLKRRPFLLPLLLPIVLITIAAGLAVWVFDARATTVVIIVRHAEPEAGADPDPNLSLAGKERAARLARVLAQLQTPRAVDSVFAADTRRAQQTAHPLAEALSLPVNVVPPAAWSDLVGRIRREHLGEVVLIVGNSVDLPPLIAALADESVVVHDTDYDNLYLLFVPQLSRTRLLRLHY